MKHLTLLLLLLCPALFYGQEDIFTESVTVEGFYKHEKKNSAFYEIYEGKVLQPVWLNLRDNKITLPENFSNTALVKIKGVRKRGSRTGYSSDYYYNEEIIVTKIKAIDNSKKLEDYLKEQSNKKKPVVNKPYESEGFLEITEYDTVFYPKKGRVLYSKVEVKLIPKFSLEHQKLYDSINKKGYYGKEYPLVKIKGYYTDRKDGELYDNVVVNEIMSIDTLVTDEDFREDNRNLEIENIEYFEEEGFFSKGLEHSAFTILRGDSLVGGSGWVHFDESIKAVDSLHDITAWRSPDIKRGIYMKVKGIKRSGNVYRYGHFGAGGYELTVSKIEAIDTTRTRWAFMLDKIDKTGFYDGKRIAYPDILKEGKEYTFVGQGHAYFNEFDSTSVDIDSIYDIKLNVRRKGAYLHYRYNVSYQGKSLKTVENKNIINVYVLLSRYFGEYFEGRDLYEAVTRKMRYYDQSFFNIIVYDDRNEEGKLVIGIEDGTNYRTETTLYEQTD